MTDSEKLRNIADYFNTNKEKCLPILNNEAAVMLYRIADKLERKPAMSAEEFKHLEWIYDRLKFVYEENECYDYMLKFKDILRKISQFSVVVPSDGELLTDDCDMRDTKLSMFVGGNGDYYLQLTESKGDDIISLCTRISMSGGIASIDTKLAIANLYRALNGKPLIVPSDKERLQKAIKALKMIANWNDDLEDEWGDPGEAANHALRQILKNNGH
jgi:hypothetical protein